MAGELAKEGTDISTEIKEVEELPTEDKIEGALCYSLGFISGIIFLVVAKHKFVRFHALQSIATFLPLLILASEIERYLLVSQLAPLTIQAMTGILGGAIAVIISSIIWTLIAILWILLIYKASRGEKYKLPFVGRLAERYA